MFPTTIEHPAVDEYAPWSADYVGRVGEGDILAILTQQVDELEQALAGLSEQQALFRFGPDEWSIKELTGHLCDFERIFFYRTLCISRGEQAALPGFDQDVYVREAGFDDHGLDELLQEFRLLRQANLLSLKHLSPSVSLRRGTVNASTFSVRAMVYILAGHVYHHVASLHTNYLPELKGRRA